MIPENQKNGRAAGNPAPDTPESGRVTRNQAPEIRDAESLPGQIFAGDSRGGGEDRSLPPLTAVLNSLDAIVLATVPETGEILFINDFSREFFGIGDDGTGQRCYELLCGFLGRCDFCPYLRLQRQPDGVIQWEAVHAGRIHRMTAMLIDWPGGKKAHLEYGVEITDTLRQQNMLKSILNGMGALICVRDLETFEILFLNDSIRNHFGIEGDGVGHPCHKLLQGLDQPCESCPYRRLRDHPGEIITWEHRETIKGSILHKTARLIDWPGGKKAYLEYAADITELRKTKDALERRERMLDVINRAALLLLRREDMSFADAMNEGIRLIASVANIDRLSVFRNTEKPDGLYTSRLYAWQKQQGSIPGAREAMTDIPYASLAPGWETLLSSDQTVCGSRRLMPETDRLRQPGCLSALAVPVFNGGRFWGFVFSEKFTEEDFTAYETDVLRSAAIMLTNAVIRNEEEAIVREANERARLMLNATPYGCILWNQELDVIDCNDAAMSLFGFAEKIDCAERFLLCSPEYQPDGRRSAEKAFEMTEKAFEMGKLTFEWMHQALDGTPIPAEITLVRVRYGDGFAVVGHMRDLRAVRRMEKNILQLESEVEKIYYDPLTEIYSRRFFEENIERMIGALSRSAGTLSLMMVDIDYFKQYNDTYGHIRGDDCLKIIADTLRKCTLRKDDFVARYGGEEFVVILPNTDETGARMIAGKMLADIRGRNIPHATSAAAGCVTVSIGVVTGRVLPTHKRDDYLRLADEMMYVSKQDGRNRYTFSGL